MDGNPSDLIVQLAIKSDALCQILLFAHLPSHFLALTAPVQRFRLANNGLPARLDELVPQFLPTIPRDPFNQGAPLAYRIRDDGGYVVYSYGANFNDDNGEPRTETNKSADDVAFTVAPPEIRDRPQVAPPVTPEVAKQADHTG